MTANAIIYQAMLAINALGSGDTPSAEETADIFIQLNAMLQSWTTELLNIFQIQSQQFAITPGDGSYTIGAGADFSAPRPVAVTAANFIHGATGLSYPLRLLSDQEWAAIMEKALSGKIPDKFYDDFAFPFSILYLHPIPSQAGFLELFTWTKLSQFGDLITNVSFPEGYDLAIIYNLAVLISPGLIGKVDPGVAALADGAKKAIQRLNLPPLPGMAQEIQARAAAEPSPKPAAA